jgi:hypothetical protein
LKQLVGSMPRITGRILFDPPNSRPGLFRKGLTSPALRASNVGSHG